MIDLNHSRNLAVLPRAGCFHNLFLLTVLMAGLGLIIPTGRVTAQTFTTLHSFTGGSDGGYPSELILSGSTLYGATHYGGSSWGGTVFKVNIDGTDFSTLHSFTATSTNSLGTYTNRDGFFPNGLILSRSEEHTSELQSP